MLGFVGWLTEVWAIFCGRYWWWLADPAKCQTMFLKYSLNWSSPSLRVSTYSLCLGSQLIRKVENSPGAQNQVKGFLNYYWRHLLNPLKKEGGEWQSFFKRHFSAVIPAFGPSQLLGCNSSCTKGCVVSPGIPQLCFKGGGSMRETNLNIASPYNLTSHSSLQLKSGTVCD